MKYKKKPIEVDAVQFYVDAENFRGGDMFLDFPIQREGNKFFILIPSPNGNLRVNEGEWVLTDVKGQKYPCPADVFEATYEPVEVEEKPKILRPKHAPRIRRPR